ncbi:MAG: GIY-YIG nuclease family protein [Selenomonadaceae bacterium]|nr:GIY-YIG nuclease family protein [Selenomonadaceae bacterium]
MENPFQIFSNEQFGQVRATFYNDQLWLVGSDVANALGYVKTDAAIKRHVAEGDKRSALVSFHPAFRSVKAPKLRAGRRYMTIINESGLYALTLSSRLPEAEKFRDWVTSEVLPAIRKTGTYSLFLKPVEELTPVEVVNEESEPAEKKYCVYVLRMTNATTKIGMTTDILERARMVERQSGAQVERIYNSISLSKDVAAVLEKSLHEQFSNQRLEGEFFNTSFEEACRALVLAVSELPNPAPALPALPLVDKLIAIADKMDPCPERQQILIRAANLLDAHF